MYWLISVPLLESVDRTWTQLQNKTTFENEYSFNSKFEIPELRMGTLDSLMVLSDDLVKVNAMVEAVVNKIRRQLFEMAAARGSGDGQDVLVEGRTPEDYLEKFKWNEAKYPPRRPIAESVAAITDTIQKLEDDLKVRISEYNQLKGQVSAISRKQTGSLAVRDLTGLVNSGDAVHTDNLTTLFVVVSKHSKAEWLAAYESLTDFVVPRSSKVVVEDNESALCTVLLFRRVADAFKAAARNKGFQVREFEFNEDTQRNTEVGNAKTKSDAEARRIQLEQWSSTAYGEAFSAWIHICAIRLFVESILRYGLPPRFLAAMLKPKPKTTAALRKVLAQTFSSGGTKQYFDGDVGAGSAGVAAGVDGEMYPYVSFTVSIDG